MRRLVSAAIAAAFALALPAGVSAQQYEEGRAYHTPWSGYWWPSYRGEIARPLTKYDRLTGSSAADLELRNHPMRGAEKWFGYCHAWSSSAVMEPEPRSPRTVTGPTGRSVQLTVGDQKGLLAVAHYQDVANFVGVRAASDRPDDPAFVDLRPDQLWRTLKLYVKQKGVPIVMDTSAGRQVWNYPVYAYRVDYQQESGDNYSCRMYLWHADDAVPAEYIGTKTTARAYTFSCKMRGGSVVSGSGVWTGTSARDHPDFAWSPYVVRGENSQVDYNQVRRLLGLGVRKGSSEPDVPTPDLAALGEDPANPVQPAEATEPQQLDRVVLSPTELLAAVANRRSAFRLDVTVDRFDGGKYELGEPYFIRGTSERAGYLYVFEIDPNVRPAKEDPKPGEDEPPSGIRLVFPVDGQDNRVPADRQFIIGGPDDKQKVRFVCDKPVGDHSLKAIVTAKPLAFAGVDGTRQDEMPAQGQGLPIVLNPQTQRMMKLVLAEVQSGKLKPEQVEEQTGTKLTKVLGEFGQDEVGFYVGRPAEKP